MVKIILVCHGQLATGMLTSLELVAGKQEKVAAIDFKESMSAEHLKEKILYEMKDEKEVLVLCDLLGGTPFKTAALLINEPTTIKTNVLAGLNLSMLLEVIFSRESESFEELATKGLEAGHSGIVDCKTLFEEEIIEDTDGI